MAGTELGTVRKRGTIVVPVRLRRRYGLEEGTLVLLEETPEGLLVRPAAAVPLETYSRERRAELLLDNAVDRADLARARREVRRMGLDPDTIPHQRFPGRK